MIPKKKKRNEKRKKKMIDVSSGVKKKKMEQRLYKEKGRNRFRGTGSEQQHRAHATHAHASLMQPTEKKKKDARRKNDELSKKNGNQTIERRSGVQRKKA